MWLIFRVLPYSVEKNCWLFMGTISRYIMHLVRSGGERLLQKCKPNVETADVKILAAEYIHRASSSDMHSHKSQHDTRVQQRLR
jgi:hypothetical protein